MKRWLNQLETKPHQTNALRPNELGLGRIRVVQARVTSTGGQKAEIRPKLTYRFREQGFLGRRPRLTSWIWILVFSRYSRRLRGDLTRCVFLYHIGGWNLDMLVSTQISLKHMHRTTTEGIEILISPNSRQPELIRLRLRISLRECSLTTYGVLSKWNPVVHESSRLQVREESRTAKNGQTECVA